VRRLVLALALVAAVLAGTARADTFTIVPTTPTPAALPQAAPMLPSAQEPGLSGALAVDWTTPPAVPQELAYPQLVGLWQGAGTAYGIPWQVLAAINKIESNFGRNMGPSSAGAIGWMQFMPSTWLRWGTDANGDGIADPWNAQDGIYSAARYLAASGGATDVPGAIFSYNHADWYVKEVLDMAKLFGDAGVDTVFTLDRLQVNLEAAQRAVANAAEELTAARHRAHALERRQARLLRHAAATTLLSRRLELEQRASETSILAATAGSAAAGAARRLAAARTKLDEARLEAQAPSFAQGAASLLGSPSFASGYVFPVGGGAGSVSVSHFHHDYPAADIAAPQGAPVYALSSGVIERAWAASSGSCGIGLTMRTDDGQNWTYCHLSYLDSGVASGDVVPAGRFLGLVGSTGHATGPHLHLQLHPTTSWPQDEPWFQGFAGTAFRWQDEPTRTLTAFAHAAPVFAEVPGSSDRVILFSLS